MIQTILIFAGIFAALFLGTVSNWIYDLLKGTVFPDKPTHKRIFIVVISALPLAVLVALPQLPPSDQPSDLQVLAATVISIEQQRESLATAAAAVQTQQITVDQQTNNSAEATQAVLATELANLRATSWVLATQSTHIQSIFLTATPSTATPVPTNTTTPIPTNTATSVPIIPPTASSTLSPTPVVRTFDLIEHLVIQGDTLSEISEKYVGSSQSFKAIEVANGITDLPAGRVLFIPVYTVQAGDTVFLISLSFGVTLNELVEGNNLTNPDVLLSGKKLIIPINCQIRDCMPFKNTR